MSIARTSPNDVVSRPSATSGRCWTSRRTVARRNGKTLLPVGRKPRRTRGGEDTTSIERKSGFSRPGLERVHRVLSGRSEEHTSELQSQSNVVCRLLLDKKKTTHVQTAKRPEIVINNILLR